jgi:K+-transporting ATPase c subunit
MWLAGILLNLAIYYGVIDFGHALGAVAGGGKGGPSAIGVGWGVLRDIGNIVLIFSFVFIGIATILGLENYGVKKSLPQLLLFAILLNFSLFISQGLIDTSNLFSTAIYTNISTQGSSTCNAENSTQASCFINSGLSSAISSTLGIGTIFSSGDLGSFTDISGSWTGVLIIIFSTIFVLIAAVVLFAAAIMLIIRIVVLAFLMVLSPIGFAGMALPQLRGYAEKWWHALLSQSFFVPVYLLLTLVGLKIGQGVAAAGPASKGGLAGALAATDGSSVTIFITFAIVIGFLIAALMSAKELGAMGADYAISTASKATSTGFLGVTGFVGRRTVGRGSNYLAKRFEKSEFLRRHPLLNSIAFRATDAGAKATYDGRGVLGGLAKAGGLDLGNASKSNYRQMEADAEKAKIERSKRLKNTDEEQGIIDEANATRNASQERLDKLEDKLERAKASGIQADIDTANAEFEKAKAAHKIVEKTQNEIIDTYTKAPQVGIKEIKDANGTIIRAAKKGYAQALEEPLPLIEWAYKASGPGRATDNSAAKKIKSEAKKKKTDKDYDNITDLLKKAGSATGGGGH